MQADLPPWAQNRRRAATRTDSSESEKKQAKVLHQAEEAATAEAGGGKPSKQGVLMALVMILARMSLQHGRALAEITGVLFKCFLLPLEHSLAECTMGGGDEYQEMVNERREAVAAATKKPGGKKKAKDAAKEDDDTDEEEMPAAMPALLPSPHLFIGMQSISTLIKEGCKDESKDATAARGKLKEAWDAQIVGKDEAEVQSTFKVWRGRRPQKQTKGPKHLKLIFCMADPLESALSRYLLLTGGKQKIGQAPKDYLEREATNLMQKLQKRN